MRVFTKLFLAVLFALPLLSVMAPESEAGPRLVTKQVKWLNFATARTVCGTCTSDTLYASLNPGGSDTTMVVDVTGIVPPPDQFSSLGASTDSARVIAWVIVISDSAGPTSTAMTLTGQLAGAALIDNEGPVPGTAMSLISGAGTVAKVPTTGDNIVTFPLVVNSSAWYLSDATKTENNPLAWPYWKFIVGSTTGAFGKARIYVSYFADAD